jgi:polyhydroxyalkanoate synthase
MTRTGARRHDEQRSVNSDHARARFRSRGARQKIARGAHYSRTPRRRRRDRYTPKEEVWQGQGLTHHYLPLADKRVEAPVLIVYGLIGRYTMADLQEDRSLVRNLLKLGVDLYVVDWGNPTRADRWLTLDDYIDGYLVDCIAAIRERHGIDKVSLLGICEGGVFTTCYAALHPETVKSMVITITPIDFHGEQKDGIRAEVINLWTRSLSPEDVDRLIDLRQSSRRVHGVGVLTDDPMPH